MQITINVKIHTALFLELLEKNYDEPLVWNSVWEGGAGCKPRSAENRNKKIQPQRYFRNRHNRRLRKIEEYARQRYDRIITNLNDLKGLQA